MGFEKAVEYALDFEKDQFAAKYNVEHERVRRWLEENDVILFKVDTYSDTSLN